MKQIIDLAYGRWVTGRGAFGLLLVRVVIGAAFIMHGYSKIQAPFSWMGPKTTTLGIFQALAAVSEFFGGMALIVGLLTPLAAFGIVCTMVVALTTALLPNHIPWIGSKPGPSMETPIFYLVSVMGLILTGPGTLSLDAVLFNREK